MQNIRLPKLSVSLNIKFCMVAVVANVFFRFCKKNRGAVAQVRRKVPIGYNGAPQIRPQKSVSYTHLTLPTILRV